MQPIKNKQFTPNGPIPGENFTSDTKNYPWHRPPEITDMDDAVEKIMKQLATRDTSYALLTVLQTGVPVTTVADIFLTNGIGAGKWTPDLALLLAGPTVHIMKIMAEDYGIKYDLGIEDESPPTIAFLREKAKIDPKKAVNIADNVAAQVDMFKSEAAKQLSKQSGGFASMPKPGEEPVKDAVNAEEENDPASAMQDAQGGM